LGCFDVLDGADIRHAFPDHLLACVAEKIGEKRIHVDDESGFAVENQDPVERAFKQAAEPNLRIPQCHLDCKTTLRLERFIECTAHRGRET
jgi:hypothetical protein